MDAFSIHDPKTLLLSASTALNDIGQHKKSLIAICNYIKYNHYDASWIRHKKVYD